MNTAIATHRGLDPEHSNFPWKESSYEAFEDHLIRGFWIEFDLQLSSSGDFYISHHQIPEADTKNHKEILSLNRLFALLRRHEGKGAMHIKHFIQKDDILERVISSLKNNQDLLSSLLLFDVTLESGLRLKNELPRLSLAQSVSDEYDIARFNSCVGGTLTPLTEAIKNRDTFDWIWFDEWDLSGRDGGEKTLYNPTNFDRARDLGFKIAVVSPELHATSPGLLGKECHPDGSDYQRNTKRITEIARHGVDLICTDFPDKVRKVLTCC